MLQAAKEIEPSRLIDPLSRLSIRGSDQTNRRKSSLSSKMAITQAKTATKDKTTTAKGKKRQRDPKLRVERPAKKVAKEGTDGTPTKQVTFEEPERSAAAKSNGRASTKGKKAEVPSEEDEAESGEEDEQAARAASKVVFKSLGDVSVADAEDDDSEAEDEEDDEGVGRDAPFVDVVKLPSSKSDKAVKARLDAVEKKRQKQGTKVSLAGSHQSCLHAD